MLSPEHFQADPAWVLGEAHASWASGVSQDGRRARTCPEPMRTRAERVTAAAGEGAEAERSVWGSGDSKAQLGDV